MLTGLSQAQKARLTKCVCIIAESSQGKTALIMRVALYAGWKRIVYRNKQLSTRKGKKEGEVF